MNVLLALHRAQQIGSNDPPRLQIEVFERVPDGLTVEHATALFSSDGKRFARAIFETLPGGTIDQLLLELLRRRASRFVVSFGPERDEIELAKLVLDYVEPLHDSFNLRDKALAIVRRHEGVS